ncbi:T9SS type A sorting domain-containing protein [bacterium]|nr:T9SS type A sorting domain-containing protein [bacterium]
MSTKQVLMLFIIFATSAFVASALGQTEWAKYEGNPVLDLGAPGEWDAYNVYAPSVLYEDGIYKMWYSGYNGSNRRIGYATSPDGITWTRYADNPVLDLGAPGEWDAYNVSIPSVLYEDGIYKMWYSGYDGSNWHIGYATSPDGITWTKHEDNPVLDLGEPGEWDDNNVCCPSVLYEDGTYKMWYSGYDGSKERIGYAVSPDGITWTKYTDNPVLDLGEPGEWDDDRVVTPSVLYEDGTYKMWYAGNSRTGYATSSDGITWTKHEDNPVLNLGTLDEWDDKYVSDPFVLFENGRYKMWYSGFDGSNARIGYATSGPRVISFSGYDWEVKASKDPVGPGPNRFSDSEEDVWVDADGQLHLKIVQRDEKWYCTEVINKETLGYGQYIFYVASRVDLLDPNTVVGLFTWDTNAPQYNYREIDIEFAKWADPENDNAQFVVQPYDTPGNTHRFNIVLNGDYSTHLFEWRKNRIDFQSLHGHELPPPTEGHIIESWTYTGSDIPPTGSENARINFWLFEGKPPSNEQEAEVVIKRFEFVPLPEFPVGDVSGDYTVSAYDAALILQFVVGMIDKFPVQEMMSNSPENVIPRHYEISIPEVSLREGERVQVPISINDATGLVAGGITLKYDPTVLKAVRTLLPVRGFQYSQANADLNGEVRFAFVNTNSNSTNASNELLLVEFEALANTEGKISPLILKHVQLSESLSINKINGLVTILPSESRLYQNYPNPFNPETWIPYQLASTSPVTLNIYDMKGHLIRTVDLGQRSAGVYVSQNKAVYWDGRNDAGQKVASGIYFYTLKADKFTATRRMVILK